MSPSASQGALISSEAVRLGMLGLVQQHLARPRHFQARRKPEAEVLNPAGEFRAFQATTR
jgi:hypothetical protein